MHLSVLTTGGRATLKRRPKRVQRLVSRARCAALGCQTVISLNAAVFKEWNILCGHFSLFKNKSGMFWT